MLQSSSVIKVLRVVPFWLVRSISSLPTTSTRLATWVVTRVVSWRTPQLARLKLRTVLSVFKRCQEYVSNPAQKLHAKAPQDKSSCLETAILQGVIKIPVKSTSKWNKETGLAHFKDSWGSCVSLSSPSSEQWAVTFHEPHCAMCSRYLYLSDLSFGNTQKENIESDSISSHVSNLRDLANC